MGFDNNIISIIINVMICNHIESLSAAMLSFASVSFVELVTKRSRRREKERMKNWKRKKKESESIKRDREKACGLMDFYKIIF